ncbi:MAG: DNA polymerase III subunit alpha [Bacillota bacterium]
MTLQPPFVHLHVHSPFSFLDGACAIEEMTARAADLSMPALALTDHNNVSAAVRFARAAKKAGIKPIQGAEVTAAGGFHLTLLAQDARGYANLCRLLTRAHLNNPRGKPRCAWRDFEEHHHGLIALSGCRRGEIASLILGRRYEEAKQAALRCLALWGKRFYLELQDTLLPGNRLLNKCLLELGQALKIPAVATNNAHYARPEDFPVHDILTCVRLGISVEEVHPERPLNDENHLKDTEAMRALFRRCPEAVANTAVIAEMCGPVLPDENRYPKFPLPEGGSPDAFLRSLVYQGADERYRRITPAVRERLEKEMGIIAALGYADYFLVVWDVINFARSRKIRCAGRGSAGASAVAYCLYLTEVDPIGRDLIFERFLSLERAEKPDIDIDFDSRHRDTVSQYVYRKYGEENVAAVATYTTYLARSAVRDIGKVLGCDAKEIDTLAKSLPPIKADRISDALERFPELRRGPWKQERYRRLLEFCARVAGFPRFFGTHVGGLIVTGSPVTEVTPLQMAAKGVRIAQFDRDDVEDLNLVKLDLLSLKALGVLEDAAGAISAERPGFSFAELPLTDKDTYRLLNRGETVGVFQLESPAQRALQARLKADNIEDVVASMALIRPGPIKGNMVDPFVARRQGVEPVAYPHPKLARILEKTYGVVLFQEQVIAIATELAGFTPGEADRLRRLMTHTRSHREMQSVGEEFVRRAVEKGVDEKKARGVFESLEGYASYGFCEAHAAAFATTAYWTAYLSAHHPVHFFTALLNNQPMGFYSSATLVNEARARGLKFLPPDINISGEKFAVENGSIRIPLSRVKNMNRTALNAVIQARAREPFVSLADFYRRTRVDRDILQNLVLCGACDSLHPNRRELLACLPAVVSAPSRQQTLNPESPVDLTDFSPVEKYGLEFQVLGLEVDRHYMSFRRSQLRKEGYLTSDRLRRLPGGTWVKAAGLPLRPHRPPTRSGRIVVFLSLEDETGMTDTTVFEDVYQRYGHLIFGPEPGPLKVTGVLHRRGDGVSITAKKIEPLTPLQIDTPFLEEC